MEPTPLPTCTVELVEDGVMALIKPLVERAGFQVAPEVETLPETKDGIQEALQAPRVTIAYRQSTFGESGGGNDRPFFAGLGAPAAQEETLHVDILIRARGRKTDKGVYPVIAAVQSLVLGMEPFPGARGLWFTGQQLDDFEERGGWRYMLSVATSTVLVSTNEMATDLVNAVAFAWRLNPDPLAPQP